MGTENADRTGFAVQPGRAVSYYGVLSDEPSAALSRVTRMSSERRAEEQMVMHRLALVAIAVCVLLVAALAPTLVVYGHDSPVANPDDFRAFYCAGAAVDARRDPYRVQPLWACELAALRSNGLSLGDARVMPAPLPPYALAVFAGVARLPFPIAAVLWSTGVLACIVLGAVLIARLTGLPLALTALAFAPAQICESLWLGQIVPLVGCCLCGAGLALRARHYGWAAAALLAATIEPHVALPAVLAAFLFVPAVRGRLLLGTALLLCISLLAVGPAVSLEYVAQVLPLHARSEIVNFGAQYSLTSLLWAYGVAPEAALRLGEASTIVLACMGIALAYRLAKRYADDAFFSLVPCLAVLLGGVFIHIHQMGIALPGGLLLLSRLQGRRMLRFALIGATVCLALPWLTVLAIPAVSDRLPAAAPPRAVALQAPVATDFAELPRTRYIEAVVARYHHPVWFDTVVKLPTWLGLGFTLAAAFALSAKGAARRNSPRLAPVVARFAPAETPAEH